MALDLHDRRVAFLVANEGAEEIEVTSPWDALKHAGGQPVLVSLEEGRAQFFNHLDPGQSWPVDRVVGDTTPDDYDTLILPGGVANPDRLRLDADAVGFVRQFFDTGKPVAVICHGPWTIVEADRVRGRTVTSWPSLRTDITNAGGTWVDREVQVCADGPNTLISARKPADLPAFNAAWIDVFTRAAAPV